MLLDTNKVRGTTFNWGKAYVIKLEKHNPQRTHTKASARVPVVLK